MEEYLICDECGQRITAGEVVHMDGSILCESCADRFTVLCRNCNERIWRDNAVDYDLCSRCYEYDYTTCSDCGELIRYDDAYYTSDDEDSHEHPYCESCYHKIDAHSYIHDYYYKPEPIFFGEPSDNALYLGVELEVDEGGNDKENAEIIFNEANLTADHIYIKHDGSLDDGFELVSNPMTLQYHRDTMPWKNVFRKAINLDYRSHTPGTAGLHIHVNRNAFGCTYNEQEEVIARLVFFYEKFWAEILRFSRRTERQVNRWASRYGGVLSTCKNSLDTAKKSGLGRYTAVNLTNDNTIEFRIFRGTLRYDTFIATLEFTQYLCGLAIKLDDKEFQAMSWLDFISGIDRHDYPELIEYLEKRRLYMDEPVDEMEEI